MAEKTEIELSLDELRAVAGYAAECAGAVLPLFDRQVPDDPRPREAIASAVAFASGARRSNVLRTSAWAAFRAARETDEPAAAAAAEAAGQAAAAAFLHPLARAHQVKHVLGAAAHAAHAAELAAGGEQGAAADFVEWARRRAPLPVRAVLNRLPDAPAGGGRVGELVRLLSGGLRDLQ